MMMIADIVRAQVKIWKKMCQKNQAELPQIVRWDHDFLKNLAIKIPIVEHPIHAIAMIEPWAIVKGRAPAARTISPSVKEYARSE